MQGLPILVAGAHECQCLLHDVADFNGVGDSSLTCTFLNVGILRFLVVLWTVHGVIHWVVFKLYCSCMICIVHAHGDLMRSAVIREAWPRVEIEQIVLKLFFFFCVGDSSSNCFVCGQFGKGGFCRSPCSWFSSPVTLYPQPVAIAFRLIRSGHNPTAKQLLSSCYGRLSPKK